MVEEKRGFIEEQLARIMYDLPDAQRPRLVGKTDANGNELLPEFGELSGTRVAQVIAGRFLDEDDETCLASAVARLNARTDRQIYPPLRQSALIGFARAVRTIVRPRYQKAAGRLRASVVTPWPYSWTEN